MRLESLKIKGLGPFRDELAINLARDYAGAKLIAITGDNGAGKTTMLELAIPGAMYRGTPTRGSLTDLATARDAMLEATFVNGARYTIRHLVDGVSGKSEVLVLDADGAPVLPDSKVRSFDGWAAKRLPVPDVLFASVFAAQGEDGFIGLKPGERKAVLLRCLGIEHLEGLAERARERVKTHKLKIETLEARMADERARQTGTAASGLEQAREAVEASERALATVRAQLVQEEAAAERYAELQRAAAAAVTRRAELAAAIARERPKAADLIERIENNRKLLAEAPAIREAANRLEAIDAECAAIEAKRTGLDVHIRGNTVALDESAAVSSQAIRDLDTAKKRGERARARLVDEAQVIAASTRVAEAEAALQEAIAGVTAAETAIAELQGQHLASADERILAVRGALDGIAEIIGLDHSDPATSIKEISTVVDGAVDADDAELEKAAKLPTESATAKARLDDARARRDSADQELRELRTLAARAPDVEAARTELEEAIALHREAKLRGDSAVERYKRLVDERNGLAASNDRWTLELEQHAGDRVKLAERAALAPRLTSVEARLAELEPQLSAVQVELARLEAESSATPAPELPSPVPDVAAYKTVVEAREAELRAAAAAVAVAEQRHADEQTSVARLAELEAQRAGLDDELADWNRLAADLGRDGLQAQLIDAAIPELNHVTNELLHEAFGPRFTVDLRTQSLDAKGKRLLETLDVVVIDTVEGREGLAETYSGGERVILQEALSLALIVLACRQNGIERPTLVRDESGAALSEGKAQQWIAMLRRAVDLIGAEHCLFVSHTPATWELADARIHLPSKEAA